MATDFENVQFSVLTENGDFKSKFNSTVKVEITAKDFEVVLSVINGKQLAETITISQDVETAKVGERGAIVTSGETSVLLQFSGPKEQASFLYHLKEAVKNKKQSVFSLRTDAASAEQYFQFYSYLSQQQNMMQDYVRTSTYQKAMLDNTVDFADKVVMDVGAGSGILSFFAVQAGAKKVYAVEASSMAAHCEQLVKTNNMTEKIKVIAGKIEEMELPEKVDIIISEPMGYMLYNERMLETYLHAKKWLKPGGRMFPTQGDLHIAPFTDDALYMEQFSKANFWYQPSFHGVDLSHLREAAVVEYFKQPVVDTFDIRICLARTEKFVLDFETAHETDLHNIDIPVTFNIHQSGTIHGLAFWFDVAFIGSQNTVWLSTSPTQPLTHWYQVRCLLREPIFVKQGQILKGRVLLRANKRQSYDVDIELGIAGTTTKSSNTLDLKNPFFRYTGQQPQPPPGTNNQSPTETYWNLQDLTVQGNQTQEQQLQAQPVAYNLGNLLNGGLGEGQIIVQQAGTAAQPIQQIVGQQQQQQGAVQTNLVPLGKGKALDPHTSQSLPANIAPVNPGSIPAATIVSAGNAANQAIQTRTSVGGGISPNAFHNGTQPFSVSHQFMIGDYAVPGNLTISSQSLDSIQFKS